MGRRVLVCDLNNFARYPTISVGYLVAVLRRAGHKVELFSPWSVGIGGYTREPPVRPWGLIDQRLRMRSAFSASPLVRRVRAELGRRFAQSDLARQSARLETHFRTALAAGPDAVLISTYLMYRDIVERLCALCDAAGVPTVVGGPYFTDLKVREAWRRIPGLTALSVGENELAAADLVECLASGAAAASLPAIATHATRGPRRPTPFRALDELQRQFVRAGAVRVESERRLKGTFVGGDLDGLADLVVRNQKERQAIVDMKWSGSGYYRQRFAENRHLQLAVYAEMLRQETGLWPDVSYFILSTCDLFARDAGFFPNARSVQRDAEISAPVLWQQFIAAWKWRRAQLDQGRIEIVIERIPPTEGSTAPEGALQPEAIPEAFNDYRWLAGWEA